MSAVPAAAVASAMPGIPMPGSPAALLRQLAARPARVARIEVVHLDDDLTTRVAVDPPMLERLARDHLTVTDRAQIAAVLAALAAAKPVRSDRAGDLRWGLLVRDAAGAIALAFYSDRFGRRGLVGEIPVVMQAHVLLALVRTLR